MKSFVHTVFAAVLSLLIAAQALATEKVNINTADAAALDRVLVGVGPSKAAAIVEYRKANGPFKSAEELAMVKGIGLSTVEQNRDRIELRTGAAPARKPAAATAAPAKPVATEKVDEAAKPEKKQGVAVEPQKKDEGQKARPTGFRWPWQKKRPAAACLI